MLGLCMLLMNCPYTHGGGGGVFTLLRLLRFHLSLGCRHRFALSSSSLFLGVVFLKHDSSGASLYFEEGFHALLLENLPMESVDVVDSVQYQVHAAAAAAAAATLCRRNNRLEPRV